jgi:hypothetical protein
MEKKSHDHIHQVSGATLNKIKKQESRKLIIKIDIKRLFTKSMHHNLNVVVLKPYLFSITKVPYRSKGILTIPLTAPGTARNKRAFATKGRFDSSRISAYRGRTPLKRIRRRNPSSTIELKDLNRVESTV